MMLTKLVRDLMLHEYAKGSIENTLNKIEEIRTRDFVYPLAITPMLNKMQHEVYINHLIDALKDLRGYNLNHRIRRITSLYPVHPASKSLIEAYDTWGKKAEKESECKCAVM